MKKVLSLLVSFVLVLGTMANAAGHEMSVKNKAIDSKLKKMKVIERFRERSEKSGKEFKLYWNESTGTPRFITGDLSNQAVKDSRSAEAFLNENKDLFNGENGSFVNKSKETDKLGKTHYKSIFKTEGIPVYGTEIIIHADADGSVYAVNGYADLDIPNKNWSGEYKISSERAIQMVQNALELKGEKDEYTVEPKGEKYIYNVDGSFTAIYFVTMQFMNPYPANIKAFVNARTGEVIKLKNDIQTSAATGTGIGLNGTRNLNLDYSSGRYYMRDLTKAATIETYTANYTSSIPGSLVYDTDNSFNSSSQLDAVDVHANQALVYDYYKNNFNRNSYDNNGALMKSTVLYREYSSEPYDNAFWNGSQMVYGDCSGVTFAHIGSAVDVVAHEFTHAVTNSTSDLAYENQSGALNESFSDVFGYFIEGQASDWLMGEDCYTPNTPGDALRSLADPTLYDQPAHMNDYVNTTSDNGGVHTNSGIPNKAFYLAASSLNDNAKLQQVYYRALTYYLSQYSQFIDARDALVQAANELYPSTNIASTITSSFASVGIGSSTPGGDTYESNNSTSTAYGPLTSGDTYQSYIYSSTDVDYYYFDTSAGGNITVNLSNLPKDYDVYLLNSSGATVARSENGGTTSESISYTASAAGKFYVKVLGYSGVYSTTAAYSLKATYPTSSQSGTWYYENVTASTPHNYTNNYNASHTYTKDGAIKVSVHFSKFSTESGYDFVYVKDKNGNIVGTYSGSKSAFWVEVPGDSFTVTLVSDSSVTDYGYDIDQVGYFK